MGVAVIPTRRSRNRTNKKGQYSRWMLPSRPLRDYLEEYFAAGIGNNQEDKGLKHLCSGTKRISKESMYRQVHRAIYDRIYIPLDLVDEVCCDLLQVHPYEIYGEAYYWLIPWAILYFNGQRSSFQKRLEQLAEQEKSEGK
jgi:hypothetical protein